MSDENVILPMAEFEKMVEYFKKKENKEMEYCPKCRGTITYDAGGRKYCATKDCSMTNIMYDKNDVEEVIAKKVESAEILIKEAKRFGVDFRFDILDWSFIKAMAKVAKYGADKYGEFNWQKSKFKGDQSNINHIANHTTQYILNEPHDKFGSPKWHLVAIAFNAMMEFFWYEKTQMDSGAVQGITSKPVCAFCRKSMDNYSQHGYLNLFMCSNESCEQSRIVKDLNQIKEDQAARF